MYLVIAAFSRRPVNLVPLTTSVRVLFSTSSCIYSPHLRRSRAAPEGPPQVERLSHFMPGLVLRAGDDGVAVGGLHQIVVSPVMGVLEVAEGSQLVLIVPDKPLVRRAAQHPVDNGCNLGAGDLVP